MVSVIIAAYNYFDILHKAIISCLLQNINTEIIVINDASTEKIPETTMYLINLYCRYFINEHNQGLASTRNVGINNASGNYIIPLDQDDWFYPNVLGKMRSAMDNN